MKNLRYDAILISFIISVFYAGEAPGQPCIIGNIKFSSQNQIDSFPILYPGCTEIEGNVIITSDSSLISNLLPLSTLNLINGDLRIYKNPELLNLNGLQNLSTINGSLLIFENSNLISLQDLIHLKEIDRIVYIDSNSALQNLDGLDSIRFELFDQLYIFDNTNLSYCSISSICSHLSRFGTYLIFNNGPGCNYMEEIYDNCHFPPDPLEGYESICFIDSFEEWIISDDSLRPANWTIEFPDLWYSQGQFNVERVPSLDNGDFAILLRSNGPGFEGPTRTRIQRELCTFSPRVDVSFIYTCKGMGSCELRLGQSTDSVGFNYRQIWNGTTLDSVKRRVVLNNIPVNPPFTGFGIIQFISHPLYWTGGTYGICEFIIDSVVVKESSFATSDETFAETSPTIIIYPNPSSDHIYIHSNKFETPGLIRIYTMDGQLLLQRYSTNEIDVDMLPPGIYLIEIIDQGQVYLEKFIKISL